jgi:hypothetical protein
LFALAKVSLGMSCSTYTYRDYATEYSNTEDLKSWQPVYLDTNLSQRTLGFKNGVASLIEDFERNPLTDDCGDSAISVSTPRVDKFPEMTMEMVEECLMEPLVFISDGCAPLSITSDFMPTLHAITQGSDSTVLVSASTYGTKHIMFKITGCVLCVNGSDVSLYIPSTLLRKTRDDLSAQSYSCKIKNFVEQNVFHKVTLPKYLLARCMQLHETLPLKRTTRSHTPLLADGFNRYCNIDLIVSISLVPSRTIESSSFDGTAIVQHGKRLIDVIVIDIEC